MSRYSDLRARAARFVSDASAAGPVLILAPSLAAADEVARAACGRALLHVHRFAFRDLVAELAAPELMRRELVPVGRFVREALAARVAAAALQAGELSYLGPVARFPGFPRALTQTFEELRLNVVDPARLRSCGPSGPDLALLLERYAAELRTRQLADHAMRVELAVHAIGRFSDTAVVALDARPRTRREIELYDALLAAARERLELRLGETDRVPESSLETLQRYLFSSQPVPVRDADDSVAIFSTSGEALECTEIARYIGQSVDAGVPFDEIGILLRSPERHQPLAVEALRRAGIPYFCALGAVRPDVAGRSLLALLHCAEERLSASRFAEYLSLGHLPDDEEPRTPAVWERLLVDAAVAGGPERWRTRLAGLREELHARYKSETDEDVRNAIRRKVASLENLGETALPILERLAALPESATWGEWIETLAALAEFTLRDPRARSRTAAGVGADGGDRARDAC